MDLSTIYSYFITLFFIITTLCIIIFIIALSILWWSQNNFIYLPSHGCINKKRSILYNPEGYKSPSDYKLIYDDIFIRTVDNIRIHGWLIKQNNTISVPTIICFHGNAGNIGFRLPLYKTLYNLLGCNILAIDYRGYGNSEGIPNEYGLTNDASAAILWLHSRPDIDPKRIFLYGQSLGGAVAIKIASMIPDKISGVMVENSFTSITDMAVELGERESKQRWIRYLKPFLYCFVTSPWNSLNHVTNIQIPILFLSGLRDELIPPIQMQSLYDSANNSSLKRLETFMSGSHNDTHIRGGEYYFRSMANFMNEVEKIKTDGISI